jgi:hypothetical protein
MSQATRLAIEGALERGKLWAAMAGGKYWKLRRNGATKVWKTRPDAFSIPVKAGMRACTRIDENSLVACVTDFGWRTAHFVVSDLNPTRA